MRKTRISTLCRVRAPSRIKLIVHDKDRPSAIAKMRSALGELVIEGITTNVDFQYELIGDRDFEDGNVDTDFIPSHFPDC